jgi:hypothetical protein
MNRTITRQGLDTRPSWGRLLLVAAMLLAFAVQGYATQTHIHPQGDRAGVASLSLGKTGHIKYPPGDNPVNCPLCQQMSHAGQYVVPAWLAAFLILNAVSVIEIGTLPLPRFDTVSHSWRGRGPPLP